MDYLSHVVATVTDPWTLAAEWIAAIGTAGSLLLGFTILARDRYVARRASANGLTSFINVIAEQDVTGATTGYRTVISIFNSGVAPVFQTSLFSSKSSIALPVHLPSQDYRTLAPGAERLWEVSSNEDPRSQPFVLFFVDSANKRWRRDVKTNKYISYKKMLKMIGQTKRPDSVANASK